MKLNHDNDLIRKMRTEAEKSSCKIIKFSASDEQGNFSYNGELYADCGNCKRVDIEQHYPDCKANHAEWGILSKMNKNASLNGDAISNVINHNISNHQHTIYIYCMTPDGNDYQFTRFWCRTCAILLPMFGVEDVYMWNGNIWTYRDSSKLIQEVESKN